MRIEEDTFGKLEIPENALYGIQTLRTVQNMSFSGRKLSDYPLYIYALAMVKKAAALTNREAGLLDEKNCDAIVSACDQLIQGNHLEQFPVDVFHGGGSIGSNMNMNEVIASLAGHGVHPSEHVNLSQSTADVCHTAIRIALILAAQSLETALVELIRVISEKAEAFRSVSTIARTCLQDGMKISLEALFSGFSSGLQRRLQSFRLAVEEIHCVNLGGTVVGCGTGSHQFYRARILPNLIQVTGLPLRLRDNLYDAAQNPDDLGKFSSELRLLAAILVKIAKDLRLLSSGPEAGFSEILLPAVQAGSSFFPGKVNPVIPETVIQCSFLVMGNDHAIQTALEHGELYLNIWEGMMAPLLLDNLSMLTQAIFLFHHSCIVGIQANQEQCEAYANSFVPIVAELKEKYGYSRVSQWMKQMSKEEIKEIFRRGDS